MYTPDGFDNVVTADEDSVSPSENCSGSMAGREGHYGVISLHTDLRHLDTHTHREREDLEYL